MENENQITVDASDDIHGRTGAAVSSANKSENVADTNDKSDVVDVIGNGQLVKKVRNVNSCNFNVNLYLKKKKKN